MESPGVPLQSGQSKKKFILISVSLGQSSVYKVSDNGSVPYQSNLNSPYTDVKLATA